METRWANACHEAAHAVVGRMFGFACGSVTIELSADGTEYGHAAVAIPLFGWQRGDGRKRDLLKQAVQSCYAGAEAEAEIAGSQECGDGPDQEQAERLMRDVGIPRCRYLGDDVWLNYQARRRHEARQLVKKHRAAIEAIALQLMARGTLSGSEVNCILATYLAGNFALTKTAA